MATMRADFPPPTVFSAATATETGPGVSVAPFDTESRCFRSRSPHPSAEVRTIGEALHPALFAAGETERASTRGTKTLWRSFVISWKGKSVAPNDSAVRKRSTWEG